MQRMFAESTPWQTPWMERVLPVIVRLCEAKADRTCFTRFVPARSAEAAPGAWARYWARWPEMTLDRLDPDFVELVPALAAFVPPARVLDKRIYSPWIETGLDAALRAGGVDTVVVTGAETDVCVLATVLGAVDRGYRTLVVTDALCSSADSSHDALIDLYHQRYGEQIETVECAQLLEVWT
ncbi:MAG: cysteine hydrolase [Caulobacteraceae bacterium]|nr:cysteine hydrolase [Caulobacteraceae bacterium]